MRVPRSSMSLIKTPVRDDSGYWTASPAQPLLGPLRVWSDASNCRVLASRCPGDRRAGTLQSGPHQRPTATIMQGWQEPPRSSHGDESLVRVDSFDPPRPSQSWQTIPRDLVYGMSEDGKTFSLTQVQDVPGKSSIGEVSFHQGSLRATLLVFDTCGHRRRTCLSAICRCHVRRSACGAPTDPTCEKGAHLESALRYLAGSVKRRSRCRASTADIPLYRQLTR